MSGTTRLSTPTGTSISLGGELGKGGEGAVYEVVGSPDLVAKLYTDGRAEDRRAKVEAMVTAGLHHQAPHISFPIEILLDESRSFVGFTMRRVRGARPIHQLWNSRDRQEKFPDATVSFMVRVAANAARTVAELHHTGCVIGDINESGFLVTDQATVILIDSDSIQYSANGQVFPCVVGTPEYLPPEHQGINQRNLGTRDANHDNFGLAVMIFRLLMSGAHPFRGVWKGRGDPPAPPKWIEEFRYAYGSDSGRLKVAPQPTAPPVDWLPDDVRDAFERAFGRSGARQRPAARDWIDMLDRFEKDLVQCRKSRFHHHRPSTRNCPWCDTEKKRGRELFGKVKTSYQQAPLGGASRGAGSRGPTGPSVGPAPANSPPTPPPRQGANNGLRNAILAIIGIAIVSLFVFGRNQGQDTATNTATAPPQTTPRQSAGVQARVPQNGSVIALSVSTPSDPILLPQGRCIRWSSNADIVQDYGLETFNLNSNAFEFDRNRFWNYWTADTAIRFLATSKDVVIRIDGYGTNPDPSCGPNEVRFFPDEATRLARESEVLTTASERRVIQQRLADIGHYNASIDGIFDSEVRAAIRSWQAERGYEESGILDRPQFEELRALEITERAQTVGLTNGLVHRVQLSRHGWSGPFRIESGACLIWAKSGSLQGYPYIQVSETASGPWRTYEYTDFGSQTFFRFHSANRIDIAILLQTLPATECGLYTPPAASEPLTSDAGFVPTDLAPASGVQIATSEFERW